MRADYKELETVGQGAFGTVIKVKRKCNNHLADGYICAMKIISINQFNESAKAEALNVVKIIRDISSPYIVKYIDSFIEEGYLYIIIEYCEKGDLTKLINPRGPSLQENFIWEIFLQVCLGIELLHGNKILLSFKTGVLLYLKVLESSTLKKIFQKHKNIKIRREENVESENQFEDNKRTAFYVSHLASKSVLSHRIISHLDNKFIKTRVGFTPLLAQSTVELQPLITVS